MPPPLMLAVALGAARTVPIVWLVPPLGGARLPAPMRLGLGLLLAALAAPALAAAPLLPLALAPPPLLALVLGRELMVGLCLGLCVALAFRAAEAAGRLSDTLRGANMADVLSPLEEDGRSSPLGVLYLLLACLIFLELGGVPRLLQALARSYEAAPVGADLSAAGLRATAATLALLSGKLIQAALALAAPVVVALWLADLTLGLVARAAPQLPIYFVGLPLKGLLAVGVILIGLGALEGALAGGIARFFDAIGPLLRGLGPPAAPAPHP